MAIGKVELPPKLIPLFSDPLGSYRYRGSRGGRGSAKTATFALMTAVFGMIAGQNGASGQILCAREHLNSLDESSLEEVKGAIRRYPWLEDYWEIGDRYIRSKDGKIRYTFAGLRHNIDSIKSKARIILCWCDEAESISETAWRKLIPTIRSEDSEIWLTWNPENKNSATNERFGNVKGKQGDMYIVEMNWRDNPWFPDVLNRERLDDKEKRPEIYDHIWEGDFLFYAEGTYYLREMRAIKDEGRITTVPYRPNIGVVTAWDLGVGDSTAIWFAQYVGAQIHLIDYFEADGVGLDYYVNELNKRGYIYEQHILPHDIKVRELGTGQSRMEVLQSLGCRPIVVAPNIRVDDGIQSVRSTLASCWFDEVKCSRGLDALRQYRREYNEAMGVWKERPLHDWTSHAADAFRYLSIGYRNKSGWEKPIRRNLKGVA